MPNTAQIIGSGPHKVICLHGWFGHARGWGPLLHSLDTQHFSYAFMDYRGYGARRGSGGPYTVAQIAHDTLALADHLGWQRFSLVGHSMGGGAIQHVLADAPDQAFFGAAAKDAATRRAILDLTTGNRLTGFWLDAMVQSSLANSDEEAVDGYLTAWTQTAFVERIQGKTLPVLVVPGEHDPALGAEGCKATWLQHYPNARMEVMANAGHYPMDETPVALATAIEKFLREVVGA